MYVCMHVRYMYECMYYYVQMLWKVLAMYVLYIWVNTKYLFFCDSRETREGMIEFDEEEQRALELLHLNIGEGDEEDEVEAEGEGDDDGEEADEGEQDD